MSRYGLFQKTLRDVRTATIAVAFVMVLMAVVDILLYPQYRKSMENFEVTGVYKGFVGEAGSFASPEGFLSGEFFSWIPLLLITVAIIGGTGALAGEEGAGTLDLLLAQPISRRRLVLEKAAAFSVALVAASLVTFPGFLFAMLFVEFDLGKVRILEAVLNMLPVTLLYLTLSLWGSAALPGRGGAALLAIGAVVAAYFLNSLGAAIEMLEGPRKLSPFYWSDGSHVLMQGFDYVRAGGLLAVAGAFLALAVFSFERRDISAGGQEWSWRRLLPRRRGADATVGK